MPTPTEIATRAAPNAGKEKRKRSPKLGIALSGGGYRAMLFHLGAVRRLNEFGLLSVMDRMSTVSGGSILGGVLAQQWSGLRFDGTGIAAGFEKVEREVFAIADRTIDVKSAALGFLPWTTGAQQVARYLRPMFGNTRLSEVPGESPRFTFNTTNMQTANLFRWSAPYAADYGVGTIFNPNVSLAEVVAASAAFPPWLSPLRIAPPGTFVDHDSGQPVADPPRRLWLTDGGVYDNLGIETLKSFHTVLSSDGGAPFSTAARLKANPASQALRTMFLLNEDVGRQRLRALAKEFERSECLGAQWSIKTPLSEYPATKKLSCSPEAVEELAGVKTRLKRLPSALQRRLANWGYASADAAVRSFVEPSLPAPSGFPYEGAVG